MILRKLLPVLWAVMLISTCTGQLAARLSSPSPASNEVSRVERRILVTFIDRSLNRAPLGSPDSHYRQRGEYQSSTWSKRIATRLAEEYKLQQVAEWPITTLGVYCVVYEILPDQSIDQVLESLSHHELVDSVQRMHRFRVLTDPYLRLQTALYSMQIEVAHQWATGRNVTVAMIDTGVDFNHPDLMGQIAERQDFVDDDPHHRDLASIHPPF